jgi:hypothetical protein
MIGLGPEVFDDRLLRVIIVATAIGAADVAFLIPLGLLGAGGDIVVAD